jgi:hypothetical protein
MTDSNEDDEQVPRFVSDFKTIHTYYQDLKCKCPEGERLRKEYEVAQKQFEGL